MTILVTGGAGFIGSNLLHTLSEVYGHVVCLDNLTYAADVNNMPKNSNRFCIELYEGDICDEDFVSSVFLKFAPRYVMHLAAESHVDNSIKDCRPFVYSNVLGTVNLLQQSLKYEVEKFLHVSTDEVYGSIEDGSFTEETIYNPRNPYSASKASSDHFVNAFHHTYGLPTVITNCSNNYGPRQYKEKLIPQTILNLIQNKKVPVYGDGQQVRDWLFVTDHCESLIEVLNKGKVGEKYNIGGECEVKNIDLVKKIINLLGKDESLIEYIQDRPGHDRRYSTSIEKISNELNWKPRFNLDDGLAQTIEWYENY
jgi:dTDP-glucose 4,6-dehydratase